MAAKRKRFTDSVEAMLSNCAPVGDCMLWKGATLGIGAVPAVNLTVDGKKVQRSARRVMWQLKTRRPVPAGKLLGVSCGNPACMEHLCLTDRSEVTRKAVARPDVRAKYVLARRRQLTGVDLKVSIAEANSIRADDRPHSAVARDAKISVTYVKLIRSGERRMDPGPFAALLGAR